MSPQHSPLRRPGAALTGALSLALLLAPTARAEAQEEDERRVERHEVLVVGPESHRRVVLDRLARRGFLGVQPLDLTPELRRHFGAPEDRGLLVARVEPGSPAAAADLRVGDLIAAIDGRPLRNAGQLVLQVGRHVQGDEVELEVWRDGVRLSLRLALGERERNQLDLGQLLTRDGEGGPEVEVFTFGPAGLRKVIAVDSEAINESVRELVDRLEARGLPGRVRLEAEQRRELERRIKELERRLLEMERRLQERDDGD